MSDKRLSVPKPMLLTPNQERILELVAERDELRAEVERLQQAHAQQIEGRVKDVADCDELRARLAGTEQQLLEVLRIAEDSRAEVERLTDDNRRLAECWTTEQEAHTQTAAEAKRLRASKSELSQALRGFFEADFTKDLKPYFDAARSALCT